MEPEWYVYVLACEDGFYYVGISLDVNRRFQQHCDGIGAWFTREHPPLHIIERACCKTTSQKQAVKIENQKAVEYAFRYGHHNVYGGKYGTGYKLGRAVRSKYHLK